MIVLRAGKEKKSGYPGYQRVFFALFCHSRSRARCSIVRNASGTGDT